MDETIMQNEAQIASLKKKAQDTANEMADQVDQLQKVKQRYMSVVFSANLILSYSQTEKKWVEHCDPVVSAMGLDPNIAGLGASSKPSQHHLLFLKTYWLVTGNELWINITVELE